MNEIIYALNVAVEQMYFILNLVFIFEKNNKGISASLYKKISTALLR